MNSDSKLIFLIVNFLFVTCACYSQVQDYISNSPLDEAVYDGIFYSNHHYFLYSSGIFNTNGNPYLYETEGYNNYILKFNDELVLTDSVKINPIGNYLIRGLKLNVFNDTIYVISRAINPENYQHDLQIFYARLLPDLTIIDTKLIGQDEMAETPYHFIFNHKANIVVSYSIKDSINNLKNRFAFMEFDKEGNVAYTHIDTAYSSSYISKIIQLDNNKQYHFYGQGITRIYDSAYQLVKHFTPEFTGYFIYDYQISDYTDDSYLIGGMKFDQQLIENPEDIAFYVLDSACNRLDSGLIYIYDTTDFCRGLDFKAPNTICFGGIHNFKFLGYPFEFQKNIQDLVIKSINTDDNSENWFLKYGGDACYWMKGIYITSNKECIVYANKYDWMNTDVLERDLLILKIDSSGVLVSENKINTINDINVFPNPGNDYLTISLPEPFKYTVFEIYDIYGILMLSTQLSGRRNILHTSHLRSGTYVYKIYNQEGLRESGKWIKKY